MHFAALCVYRSTAVLTHSQSVQRRRGPKSQHNDPPSHCLSVILSLALQLLLLLMMMMMQWRWSIDAVVTSLHWLQWKLSPNGTTLLSYISVSHSGV